MTSAIQTSGLARRFGRVEAVRGVNLAVPAGSIFALIGPNGAGKTTTIKTLMNLLRPTAGEARVLGVDSRRLGVAELQRIGYVSENQRLPLWMTPRDLFDYCRAFYPAWDAALARKLLGDLDLPADRRLGTLSRGTRMKAALLASLAYRPALVVLDEPFTGLDPLVRDELIRALLEVPDGREFTVFVSSHDVDEVERLADWVGFMAGGSMVLAEPVASLIARFRTVEVVLPPDGQARDVPLHRAWIAQERAGHTVRFIDTAHSDPDAGYRIAAAFPGATVHASPMTLRDIFVVLARTGAPAEAA
jgi:ABC-2 type transport system ATP-binding protein